MGFQPVLIRKSHINRSLHVAQDGLEAHPTPTGRMPVLLPAQLRFEPHRGRAAAKLNPWRGALSG